MDLIPRSELTPEQLRAVELPPDQHRVFIGGPGSGKTQVLLHRAAYLRYLLDTRDGTYHIFVYTRALKEYLRAACGLLDLEMGSVDTLDSWCCSFHRRHLRSPMPHDDATGSVDFPAVRAAVLAALERRGGGPPFRFVLVDEGQDLTAEAFELIARLGRHVTVCIDHKQQIYEEGSSEPEILAGLGIRRHNLALLGTYRCTPYIVDVASRLVADPRHRAEFVNQCRIDGSGREQPLLYLADDPQDETRRLAEILRIRIGKGEKVAVLVPRRAQMLGLAKALTELGFAVETKDSLSFASNRPKVLTYQSAKGLTFDTVLMPRLVRSSFTREPADLIERLLFVGITRAVRWVYLSSTEPGSLAALAAIREAEDSGSLAVQEAGEAVAAGAAKAGGAKGKAEGDGLLDLL